jgi:flavin reductase (DIM6/NTAB) family NADH-FMN oxidoreductase RutF
MLTKYRIGLPIARIYKHVFGDRHHGFLPQRPLIRRAYSTMTGDANIRPLWESAKPVSATDSPEPTWSYGSGASDKGDSLSKRHVEIDPFAEGRPMFHNYSLLVSGIVPRPIGFVSTISKDGKENLAPFSYFQCVDHDPPVFVIGFSGRPDRPKDTLQNLEDTGECSINIVSEHMIEAVNATSLDAPHGVSEWVISGLHQAPSSTVKPPRVQESVFSIEGRLIDVVEFKTSRPAARNKGKLAIIEATRFWAREDAIDAEGTALDINVLKPVGQLGGSSYARISDTFEVARKSWKQAMASDGAELSELTKVQDKD